MAGFWREFAGGFSQNSKDDNENVMKPEFDGNVEGSIKKEYVRDENLIVGPESEEKHIVLENDNGEGEIKANIFEDLKKSFEDEKSNESKSKDNGDIAVTTDVIKKGQVEKEMELNNRTIITKSTIIAGNISTEDDLIIEGSVCGDVDCKGKLTISGEVSGNAIAKAISINTSKFEGDVRSDGRIEIKEGTVIIGNIYGDEALISGAVKGEIVVANGARLEKSAIVKGNIKAKSVQIDNGAVLQGFCELQYDNLDLDELFGGEEPEEEETFNTGGLTYQDMVANMEDDGTNSLEEEYEKENEEKEATEKAVDIQNVSDIMNEEAMKEEEIKVVENETPEEVREAYMQEMEDNYSNFMDQLQMDADN